MPPFTLPRLAVPFTSSVCLSVFALLALPALSATGCGGGSSDSGQFFPDTQAEAGADARGPAQGSDGGPAPDGAPAPPDGNPGVACASGLTNCHGVCVDLKNDPQNCGGCGAACAVPAGGGQPACVTFQCTAKCNPGEHACSGVCTTNSSVATCGASCAPCPTPTNGTATCDGTECGAACTAGYHACGGVCGADTSPTSCGTSCTPCPAPANGYATCDGTSCGVACLTGYHLCGGVCASDTSVTACGASCVTCPAPPAGGTAVCSADACGVQCQFGYRSTGTSCVPVTIPTLTLVPTAAAKTSGTFTLDATLTTPRVEFNDVCPNATITPTITPYQIVRLQNPSAQSATVSVWTSKAASAAAVDLDTLIAAYASFPTTDAARMACTVGVNDACASTDPTDCLGQWAGLIKAGNQGVTVPANGSVYIYVTSYFAVGSGTAATSDYILTVRTESLP
jgi:hypothetical protein